MPLSFLSLNAIFRRDEQVDGVKNWIRTGRLPAWATKRFGANYKDFIVRDGKLVYEPLDVIIVPKSQIDELLTSIYTKKETGLAKAIGSMYKYVCLHYANITREDVAAFMRRQTDYQIGQPVKQRVNKPFVASAPNSLWCCDLIDLNPYVMANKARYRYILTVVDVFSRRVFLGKLKQKTAKDTAAEMARIFTRAQVTPKRMLADNGTEFAGEFEQLLTDNDIRISHARAHTPQSNSVVERANKEVRRRLKALFIANKSLDWVRELHVIEANINQSYHSGIKTAPTELWHPEVGLPEDPDETTQRAITHAKAAAKAKLTKYKETEFAVGDKVRVSMPKIFTNIRAQVKAGNKKSIVVQYTPEVFEVNRVIHPRDGGYSRPRYVLHTQDGKQLLVSPTVEAEFYASDLIHANEAKARFTTKQALSLNQVTESASDVYVN